MQLAAADLSAAVVTVVGVAPAKFTEILMGPEAEGLRIAEVLADEGQRVKKDDVLARLAHDGLKVAEAERAQVQAQCRELMWRRGALR
jgi:multidrug efflux pump subunit AcrA (membrane-fusion protein)